MVCAVPWAEEVCFPPFLHVLTAVEDISNDVGDEWGGRIKQLKKAIPAEVGRQIDDSEQRASQRLRFEAEAVRSDMAKLQSKLQFKMQVTEAKLDEVKDLLLQLSASMAGLDTVRRTDRTKPAVHVSTMSQV